jgi:plasmid stabilization system protein ParE
MSVLPVFFTALAEEDLDQMVKLVLRIIHAAQDWTRFFGKG